MTGQGAFGDLKVSIQLGDVERVHLRMKLLLGRVALVGTVAEAFLHLVHLW